MAEASWLPDPNAVHELRYWNGSMWSEHVSDPGVPSIDPLDEEYLHVNPGMAGAAFGAPPPAPAPPAAPPPDMVEELRRLGELRDSGIPTDEEFAAQEAKVLGT